MKYLLIHVHQEFPEEKAKHFLEDEGLTFLFSTVEQLSTQIATTWHENPRHLQYKYPWILSVEEHEYHQVDWNSQWEIHGENYKEGLLEIDLSPYNIQKAFQMKPGPGFGDLSHTTTRLTMELMIPLCKDKHVVDIGCGSGVLSLAAACSGAKYVYAIDIDPKAVEHTKANASLNALDSLISYELPQKVSLDNKWLLVMNMIHSEQCQAWNALHHHFTNVPYDIITSGILVADKQSYFEEANRWGWQLVKESEKDQWGCFQWTCKK